MAGSPHFKALQGKRVEELFPGSLPAFQKMFPDEAACAAYLERAIWPDGFVCQSCQWTGEPYRIATQPGVLRCRKCRRNTRLTAKTVMKDTHTPLSVWFWGAYLVSSLTPGISAVQFQRQLGLTRYETAFQILHKLRAGMVRPGRDQIGGESSMVHVEVDNTWVGGQTKGKGRGRHGLTLVSGAVEVHWRKRESSLNKRRQGRYAGRIRLSVVQKGETLGTFIKAVVKPGTLVVTDGWNSGDSLRKAGYQHAAFPILGRPEEAEKYLPMIHLAFSNLKTWVRGIHHGVSPQHLQTYLDEYTFRFNRRFHPFNAFRSLLGIASSVRAPTYAELYSGDWVPDKVDAPF
jgi:transposase-like protein